jgi:hypothetical protein
MLGKIETGPDHLLALTLLAPEGISSKRYAFTAERGEGPANQEWRVQIQRRDGASRPIGTFAFEQGELRFAWSDGEPQDDSNYLRNALVQLETRNQSRVVPLRTPIVGPALVFSEKSPALRLDLDIGSMPHEDCVCVEILPLAEGTFPGHQFVPEPRLTYESRHLEVHFNSGAMPHLIGIQIELSGKSRPRLEAEFLLFGPDGPKPFRRKTMEEMIRASEFQSQQWAAQLLQMQQYEAPDGEKTRHREKTKKFSDDLDALNKFLEYQRSVAGGLGDILDQPLPYTVRADYDGHRVDLVVSGPK